MSTTQQGCYKIDNSIAAHESDTNNCVGQDRMLSIVSSSETYEEVILSESIIPKNEIPQYVLDRQKRHAESGYIPIQVPNIENIHKYLTCVKYVDNVDAYIPTAITPQLSKLIARIKSKPDSYQAELLEILVSMYKMPYITILVSDGVIPTLEKELAEEIITIKAIFHELIVDHNKIHLIELYNTWFNDKQFDKLLTEPDVNITPIEMTDDEKKDFIIAMYQKRIHAEEVRKRLNAKPPKYAVNEIVGAQDKEGRWWMSQVLDVISHLDQHIYYVTFLGWGDKFNEFILNPFNIQKFNPKKHRYYRPAETVIKDGTDEDVNEDVSV